jgi:hypothetical protein
MENRNLPTKNRVKLWLIRSFWFAGLFLLGQMAWSVCKSHSLQKGFQLWLSRHGDSMWFYILTVIFLAMAIWGLLTWLEARLEARMKKRKNQDVL